MSPDARVSRIRGKTMKVLFLCTGNACRSQMAEGLLRDLSKGEVASFSAGTDPKAVHPMAVEVMGAMGIDISGQTSKHIDRFRDETFDYVITVCDRVKDSCPTWPTAKEDIYWSFEDPEKFEGTEKARQVFMAVRDAIAQRIRLFLLAHHVGVETPRTSP
jgi:thioredoxin type arsenate reductase